MSRDVDEIRKRSSDGYRFEAVNQSVHDVARLLEVVDGQAFRIRVLEEKARQWEQRTRRG